MSDAILARSLVGTHPAARVARLQVLALVGLLLVLYVPVLTALAAMWSASDDFGHGFLIPFIAGYLVWIKRDALRRVVFPPDPAWGLPLVLCAGLMLVAGKLGSVALLQELSLLVMLAGLVALLMGRRALGVLALPIGYLIFMINVFGEASERVHWPFQLLAARIGVGLLQVVGVPALLDEQYIHLPRIVLEVAKACSGIQYLTALIAIGIPLAYFTQRTWVRRVGLVAFAVVIAILGNGVRVALIGVWAHHGGLPIHGPNHVFQGVFVAWVGFTALFLGAWLLSRISPDRGAPTHREDAGRRLPARNTEPRRESFVDRRWNRAWAIAMVCLLATTGYYYLHRISAVPLKQALAVFPLVIGEWRGEPVNARTHFLPLESADHQVVRLYRDAQGHVVTLSLSYFESQEQGRELAPYPVFAKFHQDVTNVDIPVGSNAVVRVNRTTIRNGKDLHQAVFWYDVDGRVLVDRNQIKWWTVWNAATRGHANGAMVVVSSPIRRPGDADAVTAAQQRFVRDLAPVLRRYLPGDAI
ncbi:MAG: exosortase W [Nitrospirota bacterium]